MQANAFIVNLGHKMIARISEIYGLSYRDIIILLDILRRWAIIYEAEDKGKVRRKIYELSRNGDNPNGIIEAMQRIMVIYKLSTEK